MAFFDFRSSWPKLLRELREGDGHVPVERAERILQEISEETGMVEPDLLVLPTAQRPGGLIIYDKFGMRRRQ